MKTITISRHPINLKVVKFELDFATLYQPKSEPKIEKERKKIKIANITKEKKHVSIPSPPSFETTQQKRDVKDLIEELLHDLYADQGDWSNSTIECCSRGSTTAASIASSRSNSYDHTDTIEWNLLERLDPSELRAQVAEWETNLQIAGTRLARCLRIRDRLQRQQKKLCAALTILLRHISGDASARFGVTPGNEGPGEGGFTEWLHAMRLVARLPAGVPQHFRKKLWLTLADRHLTARGIDWTAAERACFRGTAQPDDTELSAQILKDLHRTGCSLFCGVEGRENQAMLRRVLLAYARWNKDVGYCQGFNMLAAIILEVMDKSESDSLKVMIYLVEAVLPEGYFADDLRGLSADMAAFRDLLRLRLPRLANHMDNLQRISDGGGVEPPLPDVFTMQWFLTLYATWLPRESLLRIWDLIFLDGNEILLLTALAIWDMLQDRILSARSADEFYSCMGGGVGAVWEAGEALVARVVACDPAPELPRLRSRHRYKVAAPAPPCQPPIQSAVQSMTKRGLRLFYSEDEGDSSDDGNKMALATVIPRREVHSGTGDRLSLDIGALKRQYARLRERQRQAHVILAAACARHAAVGVPTSPTSLTVNNLLLGKSAIVSSRGRRLGPPPGAVPPTRQTSLVSEKVDAKDNLPCKPSDETITWEEEKSRKSLNRRNSVKWKDVKKQKALEVVRKPSIDLDETGDGVIVSELEANKIIASVRSRSSSESSSYSSHSESSTDTSLCDENERASDSEHDIPTDNKEKNIETKNKKVLSTLRKIKKVSPPPKPTVIDEVTIATLKNEGKDYSPVKTVKNISEYLDSAAGEPLRIYIDGFETKQIDNQEVKSDTADYNPIRSFKPMCVHSPQKHSFHKDIECLKLDARKMQEVRRPTNLPKAKNFIDLSPIDLPSERTIIMDKSPYLYDTENNFKRIPTSRPFSESRPLDIIDSFTMYPNFVPDIDLSDKCASDLSDKCASDFDSPQRSPGSESLIISEDEPPIPLKIDKYFEHSPEFFGARLTDPNSSDIPSRRTLRRNSRLSKKPDSLTLQSNGKILEIEGERASSLPQNLTFVTKSIISPSSKENKPSEIEYCTESNIFEPKKNLKQEPDQDIDSSTRECVIRSGRKNSERALQIIQENSQILSRILTKQNITTGPIDTLKGKTTDASVDKLMLSSPRISKTLLLESPLLKESTSDSLIGGIKRKSKSGTPDKNDYLRVRPISIDDPFSFESRNNLSQSKEFDIKNFKTPSIECLGNKTDIYGWENKGFLVKCDYKSNTKASNDTHDSSVQRQTSDVPCRSDLHSDKRPESDGWRQISFSGESKASTFHSMESTNETLERKYNSDDYSYSLSTSNKYNDFVLSKASDICSKTLDKGPKICDSLSKTEISELSDFSQKVTSSVSFTYEPSTEDDSPTGLKSNSSDTLCQITSLDQISTPISPKLFPNRETPIVLKDSVDKSDKNRTETDDTCSAITSLLDTDTLSSLSYPKSPSTGSYHPFPTRPAMRLPKDIGVRLGMYPKETIQSPQK